MIYHIVKYSGPFGFVKPWTAVRDSETFSQQFLTQSIVEGIEKKLFPELLDSHGIHSIVGHRLNYCGINLQQERTWSKGGFKATWDKYQYKTNLSVLTRGVLIEPHLYLAFSNANLAERASLQTICFCRNEDILHPELPYEMYEKEWQDLPGFELCFVESENIFKVGHNRFARGEEMYGELKIHGNPIRNAIA